MAPATTHEDDHIAVLTSDHRAVDSAFETHENGGLTGLQRRDLVDPVPDTPPANVILDPGAGMIDRSRDVLSWRQH